MFSVSILKQNLNVFKPYMKDSHYTTMCGQLEFLIDNIIVMFGGRVFLNEPSLPIVVCMSMYNSDQAVFVVSFISNQWNR
jgi:hypothetical protein